MGYDGRPRALAMAAADGDGGYLETATLPPRMSPRWRPGPPTRGPKAVHEAKLTLHGLAERGWTVGGVTPTPRWRPTWCGPGSAPSTSPTWSLRYLHRELPRKSTEQQQLSLLDDLGGDDERRSRAICRPRRGDLAEALDAELARRLNGAAR